MLLLIIFQQVEYPVPMLKSLKTPPHTGRTCLRQQSRVTLSSADRSIDPVCAELKIERI